MTGQTPLFDTLPLLGQGTIEDAVTEAQNEQRAAIAQAAADLAAEEEQAKRDAAGIRQMLTRGLPDGAADRWVATLGTTTEPVDEEEEPQAEGRVIAHQGTDRDPVTGGEVIHVGGQRPGTGAWEVHRATRENRFPSCYPERHRRGPAAPWAPTDSAVTCPTCQGQVPPAGETPEGVDLDALRMSPKVRALVCDIDAGPWHYQTRHGAHDKGLTVDIKATALTEFGEQVRAALLAK